MALNAEGTSRRTLLGAALGALAAVAAQAIGRADPVRATDNDLISVGTSYSATNLTALYNVANNNDVFQAESSGGSGSTGSGVAIRGISQQGRGVEGASQNGIGVLGSSTTGYGLAGRSNLSDGIIGRTFAAEKSGVVGEANSESAAGVEGRNLASGAKGSLATGFAGVLGSVPSTDGLIGVHAFALDPATALGVDGKATFSRSGKASVPKGRSSVDVAAPGGLDASSLVLAVPMASRAGVFVQAVTPNPATGTFRIIFNKIASSSLSTPVAWFIVN